MTRSPDLNRQERAIGPADAHSLAVMLLGVLLGVGSIFPQHGPRGQSLPPVPDAEVGRRAAPREPEIPGRPGPRIGSRTAGRWAGGIAVRSKPSPGGTLDLNVATAEELQALPGIGPTLAERIVADREAHGPFQTPEDLLRVPGIGPRRWERIRPLARVAEGP